jgi:uncharacterized protein YbjT (DUF2867 family)
MNILLTGATGYIGKRLLPVLVEQGHHVVCLVRDAARFNPPASLKAHLTVLEANLLNPATLVYPMPLDAAYYLVHSMAGGGNYADHEHQSAQNFKESIAATGVQRVIYLSGMVNGAHLSEHLHSRQRVEQALTGGNYALTTLRAGIIIGSGSASFEIIRDLVEKLPVMVTPKWLNTRCQPIGIADVLFLLQAVLQFPETAGRDYDIGGPDVLTYREMLLGYAQVRGLRRWIWTVPVMTPKLSSYWLYFVTSTSFPLAAALVDSMKVEVVCRDQHLQSLLGNQPLSYRTTLERALDKMAHNAIPSSWKDAQASGVLQFNISDFIEVPHYGCFKDHRTTPTINQSASIAKLWGVGGENGWFYANFLWKIRGFMDKMAGGVGLRRGRTNATQLRAGDALDFWRVLYANPDEGRLLLLAEMKLPGEAWLEFKVGPENIVQTATFRPRGLLGRLYWYAVWPFHGLVFSGMLRSIARG